MAAGLGAALEPITADGNRGLRIAAWLTLASAWFAVAAMLLYLPLPHLVGLRLVSSVLIVAGAALRVERYRARHERKLSGLAVALAIALFALAVIWTGTSMPVASAATTAISIACAGELFATGSFWLGESLTTPQAAGKGSMGSPAAALIQMA